MPPGPGPGCDLVDDETMFRCREVLVGSSAGPVGLLQPIADLVKLVRKEAFFPRKVEAIPYIVAPAFSAFTALLAFSVIPFGEGWEVGGYEINGAVANVEDLVRVADRRLYAGKHSGRNVVVWTESDDHPRPTGTEAAYAP